MKTKLLTLLFFLTLVFSFAQTQTVTITWNFFSMPDSDENSVVNTDITIEEGDTVEWVWEGFGHNLKSIPRGIFGTAGDDSVTFDAPFTYSHTFLNIGSFDFECVPHSSIMFGTITVVAEGTLSIDNVKKTEFSIYPNPSKSELNIKLVQNNNSTKVEVYDILGKRIFLTSLFDLQSKIDVSKWDTGVYLVRVTSDNGTQTKRFVKE
jgi:hypothetical protein